MNKTAYVVIGAGYGDEGKGLMTDYLTRKFENSVGPPINVRYNGGGQAGHTVVTADQRHVFSYVGAGTFAGASTYLPANFIVNPFAMAWELRELRADNIIPRIEVHPDASVVTIFDIVLNGLRELSRGANRHGSCGQGINETVTRAVAGYKITVDDLFSDTLEDQLKDILEKWWTPRLNAIDLSAIDATGIGSQLQHWSIENALSILVDTRDCVEARTFNPTKNHSRKDVFIFEGAQGLELDEFTGIFPHVTRSQTGLSGALHTAFALGITNVTPIYVTRAYKTRHGAGPLPHENMKFTATQDKVVDKTNNVNTWQGALRFAPLDIHHLHAAIGTDLIDSTALAERLRININPAEIAVTCLDQVGDLILIGDVSGVDEGTLNPEIVTHAELVEKLNQYHAKVRYLSYGETAATIKELF